MHEHLSASCESTARSGPYTMRAQRSGPCRIPEQRLGGSKMHGYKSGPDKIPGHRTSQRQMTRHRRANKVPLAPLDLGVASTLRLICGACSMSAMPTRSMSASAHEQTWRLDVGTSAFTQATDIQSSNQARLNRQIIGRQRLRAVALRPSDHDLDAPQQEDCEHRNCRQHQ